MKIVVTPRGFAKCGLENVKIIKNAEQELVDEEEKANLKDILETKQFDFEFLFVFLLSNN